MTQDERKVFELALEALENSVDLVVEDAFNAEQLYGNYPTRQGKVGGLKVLAEQHKQAITAIKEALAQPEQEPVATLDDLEQEIYENTRQFVSRDVMEWMLKRYYDTPPQRKPLTDEQLKPLIQKAMMYYGHNPEHWTVTAGAGFCILARAIEAAHGIKE